jgi:hypothetical protein
VIQIAEIYPEVTLPAAEPEATLEAWLDLARANDSGCLDARF